MPATRRKKAETPDEAPVVTPDGEAESNGDSWHEGILRIPAAQHADLVMELRMAEFTAKTAHALARKALNDGIETVERLQVELTEATRKRDIAEGMVLDSLLA